MTAWVFRTPVVSEGPASWDNRLFVRVKLDRGVSVLEGPPGSYRAVRFPTQDEIAATTTTYMGGHEFVVTDATRAALIAAGLGITAANFTPIASDMGVTSVNGLTGPDVILVFSDVGSNRQLKIRKAIITTGNITLANTGSTWTPVPGVELAIPAAVGDYVELAANFMWQPSGSQWLELAAVSGASIVRFGSTETSSPTTVGEGDPALYVAPGTYRTSGAGMGFIVTAPDLDTGTVRFVVATKGTSGAAALYASANYPFRWTAKNFGPVL